LNQEKGTQRITHMKEETNMKLSLSDIEANALKHALDAYEKELSSSTSSDTKGTAYELNAVKGIISRLEVTAHAPGM